MAPSRLLTLFFSVIVVHLALTVDATCNTRPTLQYTGSYPTSLIPSVKVVQQKLNNLNSAGLVVDGKYGPSTKNAVVAYQTKKGFNPADGIVGPQTWTSLCGSPPPAPVCNTKNPNAPSRLASQAEFNAFQWTPSAKFVVDAIKGCFPGKFSMTTYYDSGGDHGKGIAIDVWPSEGKAGGDKLAEWAKTNAANLKIKYIIWQRKIWNIDVASVPPGTFEDCCSRKRCACTNDVTQGHYDHIHISVK